MNKGNAMSMVNKRGTRQKPRDLKYTLRRLWDYLYKFKWLLFLALALTVTSNLFALVGPKLLGYAIDVNGLTIIPVRIDADEEYCEVEFKTVNKVNFEKTIIRKGKHQNFIFNTSIYNIKLVINLQTGVMRKVREHKD